MRWRTCIAVLMLGLCPALMSAGCSGGGAPDDGPAASPAASPAVEPSRATEPVVVRARPFRAPDR